MIATFDWVKGEAEPESNKIFYVSLTEFLHTSLKI